MNNNPNAKARVAFKVRRSLSVSIFASIYSLLILIYVPFSQTTGCVKPWSLQELQGSQVKKHQAISQEKC